MKQVHKILAVYYLADNTGAVCGERIEECVALYRHGSVLMSREGYIVVSESTMATHSLPIMPRYVLCNLTKMTQKCFSYFQEAIFFSFN